MADDPHGDSDGDEAEDLSLGDDLFELWESWANGWDQQFKRLSQVEDERLLRMADEAHRLADKGTEAYLSAITCAVKEGDETAHRISKMTAVVSEVHHAQAVARVKDEAEEARRSSYCNALRGSDELLSRISDGASARRMEREQR
ncbi:unnamed protein product, partial [Polarella glacialis]